MAIAGHEVAERSVARVPEPGDRRAALRTGLGTASFTLLSGSMAFLVLIVLGGGRVLRCSWAAAGVHDLRPEVPLLDRVGRR